MNILDAYEAKLNIGIVVLVLVAFSLSLIRNSIDLKYKQSFMKFRVKT